MDQAQKLKQGALNAEALKAANVNPETGLATDYLNHFNEAAMLLDMATDMPDLAEELLDWNPCAYEDHFIKTNYYGKEVVIQAWHVVPHEIKAHFETLISALNDIIENAQDKIRCGNATGAVALGKAELEPLLAAARGCVNGVEEAQTVADNSSAQAEIDALFG